MKPLEALSDFLASPLCNHLAKMKPYAFEPLEAHIGKILHIQFTDLNQTLAFLITSQGFSICEQQTDADVRIKGSLFSFVQLSLAKEVGVHSFMQYKMTVEGDTALLQAWFQSMQYLKPDWGHLLARVTNDVVADTSIRWFTKLKTSLKQIGQQRAQDVAEHLCIDTETLAHQSDLALLKQQIKQLQSDLDKWQTLAGNSKTPTCPS